MKQESNRSISGRSNRRRWGLAIPAATLLALLLWAPPGRADLALSIVPVSQTETSSSFTGSFEVVLSNNDDHSQPPPSVNNFSIQVSLYPTQGITFTGLSQNT